MMRPRSQRLGALPRDKIAVRCDATFCLDPECNDVHLLLYNEDDNIITSLKFSKASLQGLVDMKRRTN